MGYESVSKKIEAGRYYFSVDCLRLILVLCLILTRYGIPVFKDSGSLFLNFAPGTLYLLYGYFVLRDGADLRKNIKHAFKIFVIMFVVCFALATIYMYIVYGLPFYYLTKRGIFDFIVLNYWGPSVGDYIWCVQSVLYALIICFIFRKLKKYDILICLVLFMISFLLGEGAGLIHFSFLGYSFIPGNFLTRTLPYMLLGRIMYRYREKLKKMSSRFFWFMIGAGFIISIAEFWGFSAIGILVYYGHLVGFIFISIGLAGLALQDMYMGEFLALNHFELYKRVFFLFNPVGEIVLVVLPLIVTTQDEYVIANMGIGIIVCVISILLALVWEVISGKIHSK